MEVTPAAAPSSSLPLLTHNGGGDDGDGGGGGSGGVSASLSWWLTAAEYQLTQQAYSVRIPFQRQWTVPQRTAAVFAILRLTARAINSAAAALDGDDGNSGSSTNSYQQPNADKDARPPPPPPTALLKPAALHAALRSRYRDLYRHVFSVPPRGKPVSRAADAELLGGGLCGGGPQPDPTDLAEVAILNWVRRCCIQ